LLHRLPDVSATRTGGRIGPLHGHRGLFLTVLVAAITVADVAVVAFLRIINLSVATAGNYCCVLAAAGRHASIDGTCVIIVAIGGSGAKALTVGTNIDQSTGVGIVAGNPIVRREDATDIRDAKILGADIVIAASQLAGTNTHATSTRIDDSTRVTVIALHIGQWIVEAAQSFGAKVLGARIAIVAVKFYSTATLTVDTTVTDRANLSIVATSLGRSIEAAITRIATIGRADVAVVTGQGSSSFAGSTPTVIADSTGIAIVTVRGVGDKLATAVRVALIVSAAVAVEAGQLPAAGTFPQLAVVTGGAEVTIIAWSTVELVDATRLGVARVIGARVLVVAIQRGSPHAQTGLASVWSGTAVAVVAAPLRGFKEAPAGGLTCIGSADVAVVTDQHHTRLALTC
jgi:hypothetical protein